MAILGKNSQTPENSTAVPRHLPRASWPSLTREIPAFGRIPQAAVDALGGELEFRNLEAREILFFEKEVSYDVYIVFHGLATVTYVDLRGRRILFEVLGPGDWIGALPFVPEPLRGRLRCDALHECAVGKIDCRRLIDILFGMPFERFADASAFLFGAWPERFTRAALVRGWPLRERLLSILNYLAARFGVQNDIGTIVNLPLTHADLADLVGASRPKVSHHMRLLEKQGLILHERHRITLNVASGAREGERAGK